MINKENAEVFLRAAKLAESFGFHFGIINTDDIPFDFSFRKYCEEDLCGNYGANYACPPLCGSPEELRGKLAGFEKAIVLESIREGDITDNGFSLASAAEHNRALGAYSKKLRELGFEVLALGCGGCFLCEKCAASTGDPCPFPETRPGCISAFCIDAGKLASLCGLDFAWDIHRLCLMGLAAVKMK